MNFKGYKLGLEPDSPDDRDLTAATFGIGSTDTDKLIVLKMPNMVLDQKRSMMCAAYTISMFATVVNDVDERFSEGHAYALKGNPGEGTSIRNIMKVLFKHGIAPDMIFNRQGSYDECQSAYALNKKKADFYGQLTRISHYFRITTFEEFVGTLELGIPIPLGVMIHENFVPDEKGNIPLSEGKVIGGHAVLG